MDTVFSARALMGISLAFHIIYATIGIGLPLLLMLAEGLALRTGDDEYHTMARHWIRSASVLFAIGAVSGTILSFELGFLWPNFMSFAGGIIGIAFSMEGFAFFTEAIFIGIYLYGSRRLSRFALFLTTIPITVASAASAAFVISANAWMNTPAGFQLVDGQVQSVDPFAAFFNPAWLHETLHGTTAAYVATSFAVAGVYAWAMLRGRVTTYNKKALTLAMVVALVSLPLMLLTGDMNAQFLAVEQPAKLAAAEALFKTTAGAPLLIGGIPNAATQQVDYGIEIPKFLSLLAFRDPDATVTGLDAFPAGTTPDPVIVHLSFDSMVGSFFIMLLALGWFWWIRWRKHDVPLNRLPLLAILVASPFGLIALEMGWFVTEFGRQPWIAANTMRVAEAVTPRSEVGLVLVLFLLVYLALTIGLLFLLLRPTPARTGVPTPAEAHHA
ncbi:MAG: cytochrome ubiquinol oxidase subunit I [Chloroflexi bacterium]|nr:cytochrome ubiquinol oxidase subunit I [Chloroflexota bacterium]